jgi:hypothetical protein
LRRVVELGCRVARPGEFSERAFLNDKMDLAQAEAIADLIDSGNVEPTQATPLITGDAQAELQSFEQGWFSDKGGVTHTLFWAALLIGLWFGSKFIVRRGFAKWYLAYPVAVVPFIVCLYFFYVNLSRLAPPGI